MLDQIIKTSSKNASGKRVTSGYIYETLKTYIKSSTALNEKLLPATDLANKFGANFRTVKAALSKLEADGLVIYEPNVGAIVQKKYTFAYVCWEGNSFNFAICDGVRRFCSEHDNLDLIIVDAHGDHQKVVDSLITMSEVVDGVLLMPFQVDVVSNAILDLMRQGKQLVQLDRILTDVRASSVTSDDFGGAYQATNHLLKTHKQPVYYFGNSKIPSSSHNRYLGWEASMHEYGYLDLDGYVVDIDVMENNSNVSRRDLIKADMEAVNRLFDNHPRDKYSIFASNDFFANVICKGAKDRGLIIGEDVFVVGFGNMPLCENLEVKLTTVKQSPELIGYQGAKQLLSLLTLDDPRPVNQVLPVDLIVRESSLLLKKTRKS